MTKSEKKEEENPEVENKETHKKDDEKVISKQNESLDEKLKKSEDKLLRALAEIENQRRRYEKEIKEAFEFGGFNFAKETLSLLDNLKRAQDSIKNDESLKNSKDLKKFLENIKIIEKDIIGVFEKNNILPLLLYII